MYLESETSKQKKKLKKTLLIHKYLPALIKGNQHFLLP